MPEKPIADSAPIPIRSSAEASAPPDAVVRDLCASLHATDVYVRLLIDRLELARASNLVLLDRVPAEALVRLTAASDALQHGADRALVEMDSGLARAAHTVASLAQESVRGGRHDL